MPKEKTSEQAVDVKIIETTQDLQAAYPELVAQICDMQIEAFKAGSAEQIKQEFPGLYERIAADVQNKARAKLTGDGFLLDIGDPFAAGTLRTYTNLTGSGALRLPYVLPYKDKATRPAMENYIVRASGAGDMERVKVANKALEKCK